MKVSQPFLLSLDDMHVFRPDPTATGYDKQDIESMLSFDISERDPMCTVYDLDNDVVYSDILSSFYDTFIFAGVLKDSPFVNFKHKGCVVINPDKSLSVESVGKVTKGENEIAILSSNSGKPLKAILLAETFGCNVENFPNSPVIFESMDSKPVPRSAMERWEGYLPVVEGFGRSNRPITVVKRYTNKDGYAVVDVTSKYPYVIDTATLKQWISTYACTNAKVENDEIVFTGYVHECEYEQKIERHKVVQGITSAMSNIINRMNAVGVVLTADQFFDTIESKVATEAGNNPAVILYALTNALTSNNLNMSFVVYANEKGTEIIRAAMRYGVMSPDLSDYKEGDIEFEIVPFSKYTTSVELGYRDEKVPIKHYSPSKNTLKPRIMVVAGGDYECKSDSIYGGTFVFIPKTLVYAVSYNSEILFRPEPESGIIDDRSVLYLGNPSLGTCGEVDTSLGIDLTKMTDVPSHFLDGVSGYHLTSLPGNIVCVERHAFTETVYTGRDLIINDNMEYVGPHGMDFSNALKLNLFYIGSSFAGFSYSRIKFAKSPLYFYIRSNRFTSKTIMLEYLKNYTDGSVLFVQKGSRFLARLLDVANRFPNRVKITFVQNVNSLNSYLGKIQDFSINIAQPANVNVAELKPEVSYVIEPELVDVECTVKVCIIEDSSAQLLDVAPSLSENNCRTLWGTVNSYAPMLLVCNLDTVKDRLDEAYKDNCKGDIANFVLRFDAVTAKASIERYCNVFLNKAYPNFTKLLFNKYVDWQQSNDVTALLIYGVLVAGYDEYTNYNALLTGTTIQFPVGVYSRLRHVFILEENESVSPELSPASLWARHPRRGADHFGIDRTERKISDHDLRIYRNIDKFYKNLYTAYVALQKYAASVSLTEAETRLMKMLGLGLSAVATEVMLGAIVTKSSNVDDLYSLCVQKLGIIPEFDAIFNKYIPKDRSISALAGVYLTTRFNIGIEIKEQLWGQEYFKNNYRVWYHDKDYIKHYIACKLHRTLPMIFVYSIYRLYRNVLDAYFSIPGVEKIVGSPNDITVIQPDVIKGEKYSTDSDIVAAIPFSTKNFDWTSEEAYNLMAFTRDGAREDYYGVSLMRIPLEWTAVSPEYKGILLNSPVGKQIWFRYVSSVTEYRDSLGLIPYFQAVYFVDILYTILASLGKTFGYSDKDMLFMGIPDDCISRARVHTVSSSKNMDIWFNTGGSILGAYDVVIAPAKILTRLGLGKLRKQANRAGYESVFDTDKVFFESLLNEFKDEDRDAVFNILNRLPALRTPKSITRLYETLPW